MPGRDTRNRVIARLEALGYVPFARYRDEDTLVRPGTEHQAVVVASPGWGRRIDLLTVVSSFPLPGERRATVFHFDLGSQTTATGEAIAGRWTGSEVEALVETHVVPYLERANSSAAVLDMLLAGELHPIGSATPRNVVQHGFYITKWWGLEDRVPTLRKLAEQISPIERERMERAPWGRTEIAEVLWHGRSLPPPPPRPPWGLADQGDPRAETWYRRRLRSTGTEHGTAVEGFGGEPTLEPSRVR